MANEPKILFLDIETFPNVAYVWGKYQQDVIRYIQEACIATYAYKWLGEPVHAKGLPDFKGYKPGSYDDRQLVNDLWKLLDEADIVVAHNGDDFDVRMCNARFIHHGLTPPSPYKTVDTKKVASHAGRFNSNRMDDLGVYLKMGRKIKTDFDLWEGCINGDPASWRDMIRYNKHDVVMLEKLYLKLRPWTRTHPNFAVRTGALCPKCNSSNVQFRGLQVTSTRQYQRFQCKDCGGWGRMVKSEKGSAKTTNC